MPLDKDDDHVSKVAALDGSNYHEWKQDIKMVLIMKGFWKTLMSDRPPRADAEAVDHRLDI